MSTSGVIAAIVVFLGPAEAGHYAGPAAAAHYAGRADARHAVGPVDAGHYVQAVGAGQAQPPLVNAKIETRTGANLASEIAAITARGTPAWIAYTVPIAQRPRVNMSAAPQGCRLEPPSDLLVLARVDGGRIIELRAHGVDCDLNASGMQVVWLTDVSPDESVAWLTSIALPKGDSPATLVAPPGSRNDVARAALAAASLHAAPSAARMLIDLAKNGSTPELRGRALVYLGQRASDKAAAEAIVGAVDNDPDQEVRRRAVLALSQLPAGDGVPLLIDLARSHRNADVRRHAMRYLGQSRDPRAVEFFTQVLLKD